MKLVNMSLVLLVFSTLAYGQEPASPEGEEESNWENDAVFRFGLKIGMTRLRLSDSGKELGTLGEPVKVKSRTCRVDAP